MLKNKEPLSLGIVLLNRQKYTTKEWNNKNRKNLQNKQKKTWKVLGGKWNKGLHLYNIHNFLNHIHSVISFYD